MILSARSKIKQMQQYETAFKIQSATLDARKAKDSSYTKFADDCKKILENLGPFISTCMQKAAESDLCDDKDETAKKLAEIEALISTADHHLVGAVSAKKRFAAALS